MSDIEWTDQTCGIVAGCEKESEGCDNCYAMGQVHRFASTYDRPDVIRIGANPKRPGLTFVPKSPDGKSLGKGAQWTGEMRLMPHRLEPMLRRRKPTTYFPNSLGDIFHPKIVGDERGRRFIAAFFGVMAATPRHTYQVLTKHPASAREWFAWVDKAADDVAMETPGFCVLEAADHIRATTNDWTAVDDTLDRWEFSQQGEYAFEAMDDDDALEIDRKVKRYRKAGVDGWPVEGESGFWPRRNIWMGVSVENQDVADKRIPDLLRIPAAVRFLSCEPLLGPVDLDNRHAWLTPLVGSDGPSIDWAIIGGESGPKARPCHVDWLRSIVSQCKDAGVPVFVKQLGSKPCESELNDVGRSDAHKALDAMVDVMHAGGDGDQIMGACRGIERRPGGTTRELTLKSRKGNDPDEWPEDLRVRQMPEVGE